MWWTRRPIELAFGPMQWYDLSIIFKNNIFLMIYIIFGLLWLSQG